MLLFVTIFIVLPISAVCCLYRLPIRGDYQLQLLWRGAVAGVVGQFIGTGVSPYLGILDYGMLLAFPALLLVAMVLGMVFIFVIGAIQKFAFELNLLARSVAGGLIGGAAVSAWIFALASNYADSRVEKWFICMMVAIGIIAGILCRPLSKEVQKQPEQPSNNSSGRELGEDISQDPGAAKLNEIAPPCQL
jgi:hypothetical protein